MAVDIRRPLKKFHPILLQAQRDNLNEADTVQRVVKFMEEVLGYDALTEISREAQLKSKYIDIALKVDGVTKLLVEVKAAGVTLRDRHIEQAQMYASRNNFRWVLLTNGVVWNLYHLTFDEGIEYERVFSVDLTGEDLDSAAEQLGVLHRNAIRKDEHEEFWARRSALSPVSIGKALFQLDVLRRIRREIRRVEGLLIDPEDLAVALHGLLSQETREQIGPPKVRKRRARKTARPEDTTTGEPEDEEGAAGAKTTSEAKE